jgi:hypothetical protein
VPRRHPLKPPRGSAALTRRLSAGWRARCRTWPPGLWRLRRRSRGERPGQAPGGQGVAGPCLGASGGRRGPGLHAPLAVAPGRRRAACAGRPCGRPRLTGGRRERWGVRDGGAGGPQDRWCRVAPGAGTRARRLDGLLLAKVSIPLAEAPPPPRRAVSGPRREALAEAASAGPRETAWPWPRRAASPWPRRAALAEPRSVGLAGLLVPVAPRPWRVALARPLEAVPALPSLAAAEPRPMAPAGPQGVGWVGALVGWGAAGARRAPVGTRCAGSASPGAATGAAGGPRAGLVVARTPGSTPIGCRRRPPAPGTRARSCDLPGGR